MCFVNQYLKEKDGDWSIIYNHKVYLHGLLQSLQRALFFTLAGKRMIGAARCFFVSFFIYIIALGFTKHGLKYL